MPIVIECISLPISYKSGETDVVSVCEFVGVKKGRWVVSVDGYLPEGTAPMGSGLIPHGAFPIALMLIFPWSVVIAESGETVVCKNFFRVRRRSDLEQQSVQLLIHKDERFLFAVLGSAPLVIGAVVAARSRHGNDSIPWFVSVPSPESRTRSWGVSYYHNRNERKSQIDIKFPLIVI